MSAQVSRPAAPVPWMSRTGLRLALPMPAEQVSAPLRSAAGVVKGGAANAGAAVKTRMHVANAHPRRAEQTMLARLLSEIERKRLTRNRLQFYRRQEGGSVSARAGYWSSVRQALQESRLPLDARRGCGSTDARYQEGPPPGPSTRPSMRSKAAWSPRPRASATLAACCSACRVRLAGRRCRRRSRQSVNAPI